MKIGLTPARFLLSISLLLNAHPCSAAPIAAIRIWVNAFIPRIVNKTDGSTLTQTIAGGPHDGATAIPGPRTSLEAPGFFLTDNRTFSDNPAASSRMHNMVTLDVAQGRIQEGKRCDPTVSVGSITLGLEVCSRTGATTDIVVADFASTPQPNGAKRFSFTLHGAAHNPCVELQATPGVPTHVNPSPDIDWNISVTISIDAGGETARVTASGLVEPFPAFEMYVQADSGTVVPIFALDPLPGSDPSNLFGPPNRPVAGTSGGLITKEFGASFDGVWQSTDPRSRFTLSFSGGRATLLERATTGATLARDVTVALTDGRYRVERINNDIELLRFLDFRPAVYTEIVRRQPRPSYFLLSMRDGKLMGDWFGLSVRLNPDNTFAELLQPGDRPSTQWEFRKQ